MARDPIVSISIYYKGGEVYHCDLAGWNDAPSEGVIYVEVHRTTGRTMYSGGDWYYKEESDIHYVSSPAEWGEWADPPDIKCKSCIKKGIGVSDEEFWSLHHKVWNKQYGDL